MHQTAAAQTKTGARHWAANRSCLPAESALAKRARRSQKNPTPETIDGLAHLGRVAEADGPRLEAVQLVQRALYGHIGDEVVHLIILARRARLLLGHDRLRRGEAVVRCAHALAVADCQAWGWQGMQGSVAVANHQAWSWQGPKAV